jgi:hypothetical protein
MEQFFASHKQPLFIKQVSLVNTEMCISDTMLVHFKHKRKKIFILPPEFDHAQIS